MGSPFARFNPGNPMAGYDFGAIRNMYKSMGNPMQMIGQMAMRNPQAQSVVQALQRGANPKAMFEDMCRQKGIDPREFMRNITGNNGQ